MPSFRHELSAARPAGQVLCLMNEKGDEGDLLEDPNRTLHDYGVLDGSLFFLSSLAAAGPASAASRRSPAKRGSSVAAAEEAGGEGEGLLCEADLEESIAQAETRAREETRTWCSSMHAKRAAERKAARPAQTPFFRVSVCAARTLNAAGQSRVTLSLR